MLVPVLLLGLLLGLLPAAPAGAVEVRATDTSRILGDVSHQRLQIQTSGGVARGDVLWFPEEDHRVELRPRLARGTAAGLQQMVSMSQDRMRQGAVAGINGGYWLPRPTGVPNGLHVTDGRLVAGQAVNNMAMGAPPVGRGMVGIRSSGRMVMDEIRVELTLDQPDSFPGPERIDEINRQVWAASITLHNGGSARPDGELLLYDDRFGAPIAVPGDGIIVVVDGLRVGTSGRSEGTISAVHRPDGGTQFTVPSGSHALVAHGLRAGVLADAFVGQRVGVTTTITPARTPAEGWHELQGGVAGGQLLVQNGARRPADEWTTYAAFSTSHATSRNPRTAIGRTADGRGMLVTVDGRQSAWSVGLTVRELADTMIALGAVDAVNLDGGGSTMMTVGGRVHNRPSQTDRSVADGLFLHVPLPPGSRPLTLACPDALVPPTGFDDVAGTTHEEAIACLAWWEVTAGVTPSHYAPGDGVTREQMASFVVRWIDGVTARGDGVPLPDTATHSFADVSEGNVHAGSIARLTEAGIIQGRSSTSYEPRSVMTRAQTATLLSNAIAHVTGTPLLAARDTFIDDNGSVHEANIDALSGIGVISGTGGFDFRPGDQVTRGAMAALIMRSSDLVVEQGRTTPPA